MFTFMKGSSLTLWAVGVCLMFVPRLAGRQTCTTKPITQRSGMIRSPRGGSGPVCIYYHFQVEKADIITISFDYLHLGVTDNCTNTSLKIGPLNRLKVCGRSSPPYISRVRYSSAWVYYRTDNTNTNYFQFHYIVGKIPEPEGCFPGERMCHDGTCILEEWRCNNLYECIDHSDEEHCTQEITKTQRSWEPIFGENSYSSNLMLHHLNRRTAVMKQSLVPACQKDGEHLKKLSGVITSPYFPQKYSDNAHCTWTIINYNNVQVQLRFTYFSLQSQEGTDYVAVYDGHSTSSLLIGKYYGSNKPPPVIESTLNQLYVVFHSDASHSDHRFNATYQQKGLCIQGQSQCNREADCYFKSQRCDGFWNCPKHGDDEIGCHGCTGKFSCGTSFKCYSEAERCNGKGLCLYNADELNCTSDRCSPQFGLFLCRNKRCIYESWECDRTNDCDDNSDEEGCPSPFFTRRVIVAAVAGSLICSLLLVIALGCICKVYALRMHEQCVPRHESPLSRLQAEFFRRRAPPPPYHEAMLTSRPYEEARREYLNQNREQRRRRASDRRRNRVHPIPEEPQMHQLSNDPEQGGGNDVQLRSMNTTNEQNAVTDTSSTAHLIPPTTSSDSEGPRNSDDDEPCIDDAGDDDDEDADSVLLDLSEGIGGSATWRSRSTSDEEQSPSHAPSEAGGDSLDSASASISVDDISLALHETLDKENGVEADIVDKDSSVDTQFPSSSSSTPVPVESCSVVDNQMKNQ